VARLNFFQRYPNTLSYANSAGGGVILAVACTHLIPEVVEAFGEIGMEYPLGLALILIGYILILFLEKVIFQHDHAHDRVPVNNKSHQKSLIEEEDEPDIESHKKNSIITPIVLTIALSIHSLFEGIILGVQSDPSGTVSLMIAILLHKPIETLFVGIVMVKEHVPMKMFIVLATIVCVATPIGIGIGLLIVDSDAPDLLFAIFGALAAGSFIYIATTEIIAEEFQNSPNARIRWRKFIALILGAAIILIFRIWVHDDHGDHDHDHDHDHDENHTLYY
jgi:zinc transporter 1/2/3